MNVDCYIKQLLKSVNTMSEKTLIIVIWISDFTNFTDFTDFTNKVDKADRLSKATVSHIR